MRNRDSSRGRFELRVHSFAMVAISLFISQFGLAQSPEANSPSPAAMQGKVVFDSNCSKCHDRGTGHAPDRRVLAHISPNSAYAVLSHGIMQAQASSLSDQERRQVVEYLTGSPPHEVSFNSMQMCETSRAPVDASAVSGVIGWGLDQANTRSLDLARAGLSASDLPRLRLKWAFAFPGSNQSRSQPAVVGRVLYVGAQDGMLYAIDVNSGCIYWTFQAPAEIHSGIVYLRGKTPAVLLGDILANLILLDASTGEALWKIRADDQPAGRIAASPGVSGGRVFVPLSGWLYEEVGAASPNYACCTFRGSLVALDLQTGGVIWRRFTIPDPAIVQSVDPVTGMARFGPSGAGIWNSPAIDEKSKTLYFGTGNNYSEPDNGNSDAVFALNLATGEIKWKHQMLAGDSINDSCYLREIGSACPKKPGPDADFSAALILAHGRDGRSMLIAGQKSGDVFGLDPGNGRALW